MLPSSSEVEYFLEVAQTRNISRAAERLGITQPTLSLAIRKLEERLNVPLLVRSKTGVQVTKAGTRFAAQARLLLDQWEKLRAETLKEENEVRGRFTIGCHVAVAHYSLPHFLPKLIKDHPALEIAIAHDLSRKITERVISMQVDFGIVVNPVEHPDLVIVPLCKDEVTFWKGAGTKATDLDVLLCDPELIQTQTLFKKAKAAGLDFNRIVHTSSLELIASLVAEGAGVGILPTRVARRDKHLGLQPVSAKAPVFFDDICMIYRAGAQKSRAAEVILSSIRGVFRS